MDKLKRNIMASAELDFDDNTELTPPALDPGSASCPCLFANTRREWQAQALKWAWLHRRHNHDYTEGIQSWQYGRCQPDRSISRGRVASPAASGIC